MSSILKVDTLQENTSANGITVDGLNIKDSKLVTANSVVASNITADAIDATKIADNAISEEHLDVTSITGHTAETSIADGDTILIHDASASALRKMTKSNFVSGIGGANTPAFYATMSGNQSYSSSGAVQKVSFDSEYWDTASAYDASSNYRFTPQTSGKYLVYGCVYAATFANESMSGGAVYIKKNGSNYQGVAGNNTHNTPEFQTVGTPFSIAVEMNGSSDYIECYVQITFSSGTCNIYHDNNGKASFWGANKLIGV